MLSMDTKFSAASLFSVYTSLTAIVTLIQQFYNQFIPGIIRVYIAKRLKEWFENPSSSDTFTLIINQMSGDRGSQNLLYAASEVYISEKLRSKANRLRGSYKYLNEPISYRIAQGEKFVETLEKGENIITLVWRFVARNGQGEENESGQFKSFELCFDCAYKAEVLDGHIPFEVVKYYEDMRKMNKDIFLHTLEGRGPEWKPVEFKHPFTFDALALDPEIKQAVVDDLDMFIRRKEFYNRVGRAWKRGYLLYGPPGTGKSSLVAAMANYLRFDIFDLQLGGVPDDATLRRLMLSTRNKSILVIEDIDCTIGLSRTISRDHDDEFDSEDEWSEESYECQGSRKVGKGTKKPDTELSLSGLLNFIDGLWSSCGDERIIVFTTNQKEKLDKALLRPGRMDMHIHMSYLTMNGFKILAKNYLGATEEHPLFKQIEPLLEKANVTPAQVAEELIRSEDADVALSSVVEMLKKKLNEFRKKKPHKMSKKKILKNENNNVEFIGNLFE